MKGNGRIAEAHLKQSDLLEGGQVDVHSDGHSHHQGHLIQQLRLIWGMMKVGIMWLNILKHPSVCHVPLF